MSGAVDVRAWLDARSPPAPPSLRRRIDEALEAVQPPSDAKAPDAQEVTPATDAVSPSAGTTPPESRVGAARARTAASPPRPPSAQSGAGKDASRTASRPPGHRPARAAPSGAAGKAAIAEALAEAALGRLREALATPEQRAGALDLLAADALLTYACEAAAEAGPDALVAFASAYGPPRFGRLLDRV